MKDFEPTGPFHFFHALVRRGIFIEVRCIGHTHIFDCVLLLLLLLLLLSLLLLLLPLLPLLLLLLLLLLLCRTCYVCALAHFVMFRMVSRFALSVLSLVLHRSACT